MTASNAALLFLLMGFLAALPGLSSLLIATESASGGFARGACVAAGVVAGDLVYVLVAVLGLQALVAAVSAGIDGIGYVAAGLLAWLAFRHWRAQTIEWPQQNSPQGTSLAFLRGFVVTLADQKALLFYLALLPAFFDFEAAEAGDFLSLIVIALMAVGSAKLAWAWLGVRVMAGLPQPWQRHMNRLAATILLGVCCWLVCTELTD
ncbi:MAG: LysE family translocator [Halothiobacillaceae bacterium]